MEIQEIPFKHKKQLFFFFFFLNGFWVGFFLVLGFFLLGGVARPWQRLSREVVESPSLEIFRT